MVEKFDYERWETMMQFRPIEGYKFLFDRLNEIVDEINSLNANSSGSFIPSVPKEEEKALPCPWCNVIPDITEETECGDIECRFRSYKLKCNTKGCFFEDYLSVSYEKKSHLIKEWNKREVVSPEDIK